MGIDELEGRVGIHKGIGYIIVGGSKESGSINETN